MGNYTQKVIGITHDNKRIISVSTCDAKQGDGAAKKIDEHGADYFLSTMPLKALILGMDPVAPGHVIDAAKKTLLSRTCHG